MITKKIGNFKEHNVYLTLKIIELLLMKIRCIVLMLNIIKLNVELKFMLVLMDFH